MSEILISTPTPPFLRWVGGKRILVKRLRRYLPFDAANRRYIEPFVGAGSLFFALGAKHSVLSDMNEHLIECYKHIKSDYALVHKFLQDLSLDISAHKYYEVRDKYNSSDYSAEQASRFIYLNRTCFNGIFRVNRMGSFNVPFGSLTKPLFPSLEDLRMVSYSLRTADLHSCDYSITLKSAREGDMVYLDPPYPPLNGTSFFTHYTPDRFSSNEQVRVASSFTDLNKLGCLVIMTNADTPQIRELYRGYEINPIRVARFVSGSKVKNAVNELVITNYHVSSPELPANANIEHNA